ncbi:MAG: Pr6Pr family membrane protein [Clostridia bacterium]|nr:Pr6Pr family membrane protein [Clostridia bacterium]
MNGYNSKKLAGVFLLIVSTFALLVIFHRIGCYFYEYDPEFAPYDYGRLNFFSYFTIQSNVFVIFYLAVKSFALLGSKRCEKMIYNSALGAFATTYIIVTGVVFSGGVVIKLTPPFLWDTPVHSMSAFTQIFHHMIIPPFVLLLWLLQKDGKYLSYRKLPLFGIYPAVYSLFSVLRGKLSNPHFYAYPFYNPEFVYGIFHKDKAYGGEISGYLLMIPLFFAGIGFFIGVAALVLLVHNKRVERKN